MDAGMNSMMFCEDHIPRELKTLWQRLVMQLLTLDQSRTDVYPIASDLVFILPKLVLGEGQNPANTTVSPTSLPGRVEIPYCESFRNVSTQLRAG